MLRTYPTRPIVGVGIVVLRPDAVLLVRRGKPPDEGRWSLPGGAQEIGETVEAAARRELREETNLDVCDMTLAAHVDSIHRDPEGIVEYHYTILDFVALWRGDTPRAGSDVTEVTWGRLTELDKYHLWDEALRIIKVAKQLISPATVVSPAH